jgi:periplasmic protein TonB
MRLPALILCMLVSSGATALAEVNDDAVSKSLTLARELYGAAEYEQALSVLDRIHDTPSAGAVDVAASIEQYRAFCLMALGRANEAEQAMATLVLANPTFAPDDAALSPRLRTAFRSVRARTLPVAIQRQYDAAKAAFDRREFAVASVGFAGVLRLMDDPDVGQASAVPPLSHLKTLASGFRDLSISAAAPPVAPPTTAAVAPPPAPAAPPVRAIYTGDDPGVIAPVAEKQALPPYPADLPVTNRGMLELVINERGGVVSAAMRVSINPRYDRLVLDAARMWRYRPATRAGVPVTFRKTIQIAVRKPDVR